MKNFLKYFLFYSIVLNLSIHAQSKTNELNLSNSIKNYGNKDKNERGYYTINTIGVSIFSKYLDEDSTKSYFNLTTIHGIYRKAEGILGAELIVMGLGVNFDFTKKFTTTIFYEPRLIYSNINLYANLGYAFGEERLKGFAFATGLGISPVKIGNKLRLNAEIGIGGKGDESFYFVRGGIIYL